MIKTLILVRHGIAEKRECSFTDIRRSLTAEGKADSVKMANYLLETGTRPDFIITSSAVRAVETAMIFAGVFKIDKKNILSRRTLYYCSAKTVLDQVCKLPETIDCVMFIAHNPGISDLNRGLSAGKSFYMDNAQVTMLEYEMEHWYQIDEQKPLTYKTKRPLEITP